jgi:ABC-type proline/glycine betaine transport system permease subunit
MHDVFDKFVILPYIRCTTTVVIIYTDIQRFVFADTKIGRVDIQDIFVFGLFGLAFFVKFMGFKVSIISGSLTLGILVLPGIISAAQEALMSVPQSIREAALALGATPWKTIRTVVLPSALPGPPTLRLAPT